MTVLADENKRHLRDLVARGIEGHAKGYTPRFNVMGNEAPYIHELMKAHPGVGYLVTYPNPYEKRSR